VSGAPYKIPRPHTLHGQAAFAALGQNANASGSTNKPEPQTSRSMDTLSLSNNDFYAMFGSAQFSPEGVAPTTMASSLDTVTFQDSPFSSQPSPFRQGSNSPSSNVGDAFPTQQWPWSTAASSGNGTFPYGSLSTSPSQDCLPNLESDWSIPSTSFDPLWSAGDLPLDPSKFTGALAQPLSHSGESKQSGPGLTAASSAHSEVGESNMFGDIDIKAPQSAASESLFWEDSPVYCFNTSAPQDNMMAAVTMPGTSVSNMQGLDSDFTKGLSAGPTSMSGSMASDFADTAAIAMPSNLEDNVSIDPWPIEQNASPFGGLGGLELSYPNNWF